MILLRFYFLIMAFTIGASLLVGLLLKDKRWFRFAWQLFKFSIELVLVVAAAVTIGRLALL